MIKKCGGIVCDGNRSIDLLIADFAASSKFIAARNQEIPIITKDWVRFVYDRAMALDYHFHGLDVIQDYLSDLQAPPQPPAQLEMPENFDLFGQQQQPPAQLEMPEDFGLVGQQQQPPVHQNVEPETEYEISLKMLLKDYQKIVRKLKNDPGNDKSGEWREDLIRINNTILDEHARHNHPN
uniref:BRCT domain-containing protein n=1 Tax=Panagrolaimus sp. JU765 TaxID=591449 RepID=A0AC34RD86_9BILA